MKLVRMLLTLFGAMVAVLVTLLILFLYTPSWQRGLLESVLQSDRARAWQLGQIHLSPWRAEVSDLFILGDQFGAEVKQVRVEGALWAELWRRSLNIETGEIQGLYLDLTKMNVGRSSDDWMAFVDRLEKDPELWRDRLVLLMSRIEARGWHLRMEDIKINGGVLLPGERYVPIQIRILEADSTSPREAVLQLAPQASGDRI